MQEIAKGDVKDGVVESEVRLLGSIYDRVNGYRPQPEE